MASRTKKAALMAASPTSLSAAASGKTTQTTTTKWYEEIDYYDDDEIDEFNRETSTAKNSRHSLETDEEESEHELDAEQLAEDVEATEETDGVMAKLFQPRSKPTPQQPQPLRPRAPTNEKLEKYKFIIHSLIYCHD